MSNANIRSGRDDHERYCTGPRHEVRNWGQPGDVRLCWHGHILLAYEVPGTVPPYWRTLSPVWNPIKYRRARHALTRAPRAA